MAPKAYLADGSPPCRTLLIVARAVGLQLEEEYLDFMKLEHLNPEFVKYGYFNKEIDEPTPKMIEDVKEAYGLLEDFLKGKTWVVLDHVTLADLSIYPTVMSLDIHEKIHPKTYPNITEWLKRVRALPCLQADEKNQQAFEDFIKIVRP